MVYQVNWSEREGRESIEQVYSCSASLSGDAVVIFVRALCAVSQEELVTADADEPPRSYTISGSIYPDLKTYSYNTRICRHCALLVIGF